MTRRMKLKNFQPPVQFSSTFKRLNLQKKSRTFKDAWEPWLRNMNSLRQETEKRKKCKPVKMILHAAKQGAPKSELLATADAAKTQLTIQ